MNKLRLRVIKKLAHSIAIKIQTQAICPQNPESSTCSYLWDKRSNPVVAAHSFLPILEKLVRSQFNFLLTSASCPFLIFQTENNQYELRITENSGRLFILCSESQIDPGPSWVSHHGGSTSVPSNSAQIRTTAFPVLLRVIIYTKFLLTP